MSGRPGRHWDRFAARLVPLVALAVLVGGCGFQLRGAQTLPFDSITVTPSTTPLAVELQRNLAVGSNAAVVPDPKTADAVLSILAEAQEKVILSLNTQGRVREYQLRYRILYRVASAKGIDFIPPTNLLLTRDITYNDQVLAKENEEVLLYREMRTDAVQQILRRLSTAKQLPPGEEE